MVKISVQIVTWNSKKYIGDCLKSLVHQTFTDFSVTVIDNASHDGTVQFIREQYPRVRILQNLQNKGYSRAHNQGIRFAESEYVLVLNPDVVLTHQFLELLVAFADEHSDAGSFSGKGMKLRRAYDEDVGSELPEFSEIIDSAGLEMRQNRSFVNRGEGQKDEGQFNRDEEIFGFSGSCVLFRRTALEDIVIGDEYFDTDFFAYKEDVDLAWRLQLLGWRAWYVSDALYYHYRRFDNMHEKNTTGTLKNRRKVSASLQATERMLKSLSLKNHHLLLVKNEQRKHLLKTFWKWFPREIGMIGYSLIFEPYQWKTWGTFFKQLPKIKRKRAYTMEKKKVTWEHIAQWFK